MSAREPFLETRSFRPVRRHETDSYRVKAQPLGLAPNLFRQSHGTLGVVGDWGQSKYTVNFAVHCLAKHFEHEPVMRVFQSVSFGSKRHEMPPDFSISVQRVCVDTLVATLQDGGIGTSQFFPDMPFLIPPIWHEAEVCVSRPRPCASVLSKIEVMLTIKYHIVERLSGMQHASSFFKAVATMRSGRAYCCHCYC
jgi:hypothetical protein